MKKVVAHVAILKFRVITRFQHSLHQAVADLGHRSTLFITEQACARLPSFPPAENRPGPANACQAFPRFIRGKPHAASWSAA